MSSSLFILNTEKSKKGWPTNEFLISPSKYFFSKGKSNSKWSINLYNIFFLFSLHAQTCGATKWTVLILLFIFLTLLRTRYEKSGESTEKITLGLNSNIFFTVKLIFSLIENKLALNNKAGYYSRYGKKPINRGVARNPVDHPHGGRAKSVKYQRTPWGKTTK